MNIRLLGQLYVSFFKIGGLTFGGKLIHLIMKELVDILLDIRGDISLKIV